MKSLPSHGDYVCICIDHEIAYFEPRLLRLLRRNPAQLGSDPCQKFGHAKGFCQIVISTFVKSLHLHCIRITNAEHDDRGPV